MKATLEKWAKKRQMLLDKQMETTEWGFVQCYDALQAADAPEVDNQRLLAMIEEYEAKVGQLREQYNELLLSVCNKHEGETRHETALRYIREAEASFGGPYEASSPKAAG